MQITRSQAARCERVQVLAGWLFLTKALFKAKEWQPAHDFYYMGVFEWDFKQDAKVARLMIEAYCHWSQPRRAEFVLHYMKRDGIDHGYGHLNPIAHAHAKLEGAWQFSLKM